MPGIVLNFRVVVAPVASKEPDPWIDGFESRRRGVLRGENFYQTAEDRQLWESGWLDADAELNHSRPQDVKRGT